MIVSFSFELDRLLIYPINIKIKKNSKKPLIIHIHNTPTRMSLIRVRGSIIQWIWASNFHSQLLPVNQREKEVRALTDAQVGQYIQRRKEEKKKKRGSKSVLSLTSSFSHFHLFPWAPFSVNRSCHVSYWMVRLISLLSDIGTRGNYWLVGLKDINS